jgi:hypothetical protein
MTLTGDADLQAALGALSQGVAKRMFSRAFERAGDVLASAMRDEINGLTSLPLGKKRRGRLHSAGAIGFRVSKFRGGIAHIVGPVYAVAPHGHLVEYGHRIVTGGTTPRVKAINGQKYVGKSPTSKRGRTGKGSVRGSTVALPFGARAFERTKSQMWAIVQQEAEATLQREIAKASKG